VTAPILHGKGPREGAVMRTRRVNRLNLPMEELGVTADGIGAALGDLVSFLRPRL